MEDLGQRLCDLIQHAVHAPEPETSLRAVAAVRQDLAVFEQTQVARALRRGASFGDLARVLGISRQAAHRRYRDLASGEPADPGLDAPRGGRMLVTSEARAVVKFARQEASALCARMVGTEHLLLGILRLGDPQAAAALKALGADLAATRANAQGTLSDGSLDGVPEGPRGISPHARAVFERSLREAVRRGDGYIGPEHLLIATIRDDEGGAHRTLQALGIDALSLAARL